MEKKSGCLDKRPPISYRHRLYDQWYTGTAETKDKALQFSGRSYQTGARLGTRILNKIRWENVQGKWGLLDNSCIS